MKGLTNGWSERRTAGRFTFEMISTLSFRATRALVRLPSSWPDRVIHAQNRLLGVLTESNIQLESIKRPPVVVCIAYSDR